MFLYLQRSEGFHFKLTHAWKFLLRNFFLLRFSTCKQCYSVLLSAILFQQHHAYVHYHPSCSQIIAGFLRGVCHLHFYISFHFFSLFGHKIAIILNTLWFIGNVTDTDTFFSTSFLLHPHSLSDIFSLFPLQGAISILIKPKCTFFQFPQIINLCVFHLIEPPPRHEPDWNLHVLWCFSSVASAIVSQLIFCSLQSFCLAVPHELPVQMYSAFSTETTSIYTQKVLLFSCAFPSTNVLHLAEAEGSCVDKKKMWPTEMLYGDGGAAASSSFTLTLHLLPTTEIHSASALEKEEWGLH